MLVSQILVRSMFIMTLAASVQAAADETPLEINPARVTGISLEDVSKGRYTRPEFVAETSIQVAPATFGKAAAFDKKRYSGVCVTNSEGTTLDVYSDTAIPHVDVIVRSYPWISKEVCEKAVSDLVLQAKKKEAQSVGYYEGNKARYLEALFFHELPLELILSVAISTNKIEQNP